MLVYSELVVAFLENLAANPSAGATAGRFYYNTVSNEMSVRASAAFKPICYADLTNLSGTVLPANGGTGAALTAANGAVVYSGASALALSAVGVKGQRLVSQGATTPIWQWQSVKAIGTGDYTANVYTISNTDGFDVFDATTGNTARTVTLPASASNASRVINIRKADSGTGSVTIARAGSDTIDGATSDVLNSQYASITLLCVGAVWYVLEVHDSGQVTLTLSGGTTTSPTGVYYYSRNNKVVTIGAPGGDFVAVSNATTQPTISGIPTGLRPARQSYLPARTFDNSVTLSAIISFETNGTILIYNSLSAGSTFTNANNKGLAAGAWTYSLQ